MCFDTESFKPELQQARKSLPYHVFAIQFAYMSLDIKPRGEAIREAVTAFGPNSIVTSCVRLINELEDQGWLGQGKEGCLTLLDDLYDVPRLRRGLLDAEIASVIVGRAWKCFKNPEVGIAEITGCIQTTVLHIHMLVRFGMLGLSKVDLFTDLL